MTGRNFNIVRESSLRGAFIVVALLMVATAGAQTDYGYRLGQRQGGEVHFTTTGPGVLMDALDPTVKRWYLPQELFGEYRHSQWSYTNYARDPYLRYIEPNQEGSHFYDTYGKLVTRGWLVYDWRQTQARTVESSQLTKERRYASWFNRLIVSSDQSGDYGYSIMVGDEVFANLTPMTFRKAGFNGVVTSFSSSRVRATGLFSRISMPIVEIDPDIPTASQDNFTNLMGGRIEADVTDFATLGLTLVNAHNGAGNRESFQGNPLKGQLTSGQLGRRLNQLIVRLSDDSPEDGAGGAVLFGADIAITTSLLREVPVEGGMRMVAKDTTISGSSIGFLPVIEGGAEGAGFLRADGGESILLKYTLAAEEGESEQGTLRLLLQRQLNMPLDEADEAITRVKNVRFSLTLANDYRVEVASDRHNDKIGTPQFAVMARADGNVQNQLNPREVIFDYGLPTATQLFGFTAELRDVWGFDFYGEFNLSTRYRQFPSTVRDQHRSVSGVDGDLHALGFMFNLSKRAGPWHLFLEGFGMDDDYMTTHKPVDSRGLVDYAPEATERLYDFIDDNDDNDRHPDQRRLFQGGLVPPQSTSVGNFQVRSDGVPDPAVFPGYDENGDFISDFNQNSNGDRENFFPDYEEPFLRHNSDRPEFLFGIDLNNNGWAERFENDDLPDYPYKKDHWGYNAYGSARIKPEAKITLGHLRQDKHKADRHNHTAYGIFAYTEDFPGRGRVQVFNMLKKAEDTIVDPLSQWLMPSLAFGAAGQTSGRNVPVPDLLAAEDTWINTFYADWSYNSPRRWSSKHRFKWERWSQRDADKVFALDDSGARIFDAEGLPVVAFDPLGSQGRNGRRTSGFTGFINKVDYAFDWGQVVLSPRFKSEYLREVPFSLAVEKSSSWDGIFSLVARLPFMRDSHIELGFEQRLFQELTEDEGQLVINAPTGDFRGTVYAAQLTNKRSYLGYQLITQLGLRFDRRSLEVVDRDRETRTAGLAFLTMFASL